MPTGDFGGPGVACIKNVTLARDFINFEMKFFFLYNTRDVIYVTLDKVYLKSITKSNCFTKISQSV